MKNRTIDDYLDLAKTTLLFYLIMTVISFFVLLVFGYIIDFYYVLLMDLLMLFASFSKLDAYLNLKKIRKYLVDNHIISKIGIINYWNDKNYFLTDNYMIIKNRNTNDIYAFTYDEILEIYEEKKYELSNGNLSTSQYNEYLHIVLRDYEVKVLTYTTILVDEDYKNIKDYLLNKNPNIKILDTLKTKKINIFVRTNK